MRERFWESGGRRSRGRGCLMLVLGLIVILIILSVLFGGFQKGTKVSGTGQLARPQGSSVLPVSAAGSPR
jgi:hypothetical protein